MRINQFQFLVELNKHGSFSKVAENLLISQPSISRAIKELEDELGYPVLKRSKKGVEFTEQGELVLENAMVIMEKIMNIKQTGNATNNNLKGNVYIGITPFFCDALASDILINLKRKYPQITIQLKEDYTSGIIKGIIEKKLDIGVILMYDSDKMNLINEIIKNDLKYSKLFKDNVCFYVGSNNPLSKKKYVKISEILRYQYVTSANPAVSAYTLKLFKKFGYDKEIIEIRNRNSLRKFVAMSDAVTAMPQKLYNASEKTINTLIPITAVNFSWGCEVGWVRKKDKFSILERKVIEELALQCKNFNTIDETNLPEYNNLDN